MTLKTLPLLTEAFIPMADTLLKIRRSGQIEDEKITLFSLVTVIFSDVAITGGTIDDTIIGSTTEAAATFTTLTSISIDTGQGAVECYAMDQPVLTTSNPTFNSLSLTVSLPVTQGGTGANTSSGARTNLGVAIGIDVQAFDAGLQSISGLTTSADKGIYTTAPDTYTTFDLTAGGRALCSVVGTAGTFPVFSALNTITLATITTAGADLLDDATASDQRDTLGVAIGIDVQAFDAGLQSISGLTTAADRMIYTTAPDTYSVTDLTNFARTLLDDANAADMRTTLGLGTMATQNANNVSITGGTITGITPIAITEGGTNANNASAARVNLGLGTIATQNANNVSITGGSVTGIADVAIVDGGTSASDAVTAFDNLKQDATTSVTGVSFLSNRVTASLGIDTDHDLDITAGVFNFDDGTGQRTTIPLTKRIDATFLVGTGNGGLFTGTVAANTTYHFFIIYDPIGDVVDAGWDTDLGAANAPVAFTKKRRLISQVTDASSNLINGDYFFDRMGNYEFILKLPIQDFSASVTTTPVTIDVTTPNDLNVKYLGSARTANTESSVIYYYSPLSDDPAISLVPSISIGDNGNESAMGRFFARTNTSAQIRAVSSGSHAASVYAMGWYDDNFNN